MGFLKSWFFFVFVMLFLYSGAQETDTTVVATPDSTLRIINLNPYFTLHVDSSLNYQLEINKGEAKYFWYLKNSPVGLRINKDNGLLSFRADKSYFLSGKLKYDVNYYVNLGVQNLSNPAERVDTTITILFYNTEIITSKVKPTVSSTIRVDEGETVSFKVFCETGSFPIEDLITLTSFPIEGYTDVKTCGDTFAWKIPYEFVKETDSGGVRPIVVSFIGATKFRIRDTAQVRVIVRNALNYPVAVQEYNQTVKNVERYVLQLKYTFLQLDRRLKKTRSTRTMFDLTSASTSLTGTILATSSNEAQKKYGQVFPSVGLALVPIKEAAVPNKVVDQNQAALVRTSIKRLDYVIGDNVLIGERDNDIARKTVKLRDELKQVQVQLIDVPVELTNNFTEEQLNRYFNSPKVNKKYRLKRA